MCYFGAKNLVPLGVFGLISAFKKKLAPFWQQNDRIIVFLEPNPGLRLYLVRSMSGINILIEKLDGNIIECCFIVALPELKGEKKLEKWGSYSIVSFEGE